MLAMELVLVDLIEINPPIPGHHDPIKLSSTFLRQFGSPNRPHQSTGEL